MIRTIIIYIACASLLLGSVGFATDWHMFHGNNARTGFSSENTTAGLVPLWTANLGSAIYNSPIVADGRLFITTTDARLIAFDPNAGTVLWQTTLGSWADGAPMVSDGRLYIGCVDHRVYCFNASTGALNWVAQTGSWVESSPLVFAGKVYIGSMDHRFYAFNALTGAQVFSIPTEGDVLTAPSTDGQNVYFAGDDEQIHAITQTGGTLWTVAAGGAVYGAPLAAEGKIVYGSIANGEGLSYNRLRALDASTGAQVWQQQFGEHDFIYGTPAVGYGNVYMATFQGTVYAYDLDNGAPVWSRTLGDWAFLSSGALANGVLYIGCNDGKVYALDAFTGVLLDNATTAGFIQSSPAVANGKLYVGSADGTLRAFSLNSAVEVTTIPGVTTVPPGGTLEFTVIMRELSGQPQNFQLWYRITRPNGDQRDYGTPFNMSLAAGQELTRTGRLFIPASVSGGNFHLTVNVGSAPQPIWDASCFAFTVSGADATGSGEEKWAVELSDAEPNPIPTTSAFLPMEFALQPPSPNPFNPTTTLHLALPEP
ncbi:MAG: PQQ-binding-like beta-propeller repeat protein, partial [bacterium]